MRKLIYMLVSIVSVSIVALLSVFLLLATETGSRWLMHHATAYVPGQLTIGRMQGSVLSGLNFYKVDQYIDQRHIQIQHVKLNWKPMALLDGNILFRSLNITGITYTEPVTKEISSKNTIKSPRNITFPFSITAEKARLDHIDFYQGSAQHSLNYVQLTGRVDKNGILLKRLEAQGENIHVDLQGHMGLRYPYPFQANVNWSTSLPGKVKAKGKCDINGDINFLKFKHKLRKPLVLNTRGEVNIGCSRAIKDKTALYDINLKGDLTGPGIPPIHIETHAQSDLTILRVDSLIAHTLGGMVKVNGHIILKPEPKGNLTVHAIDIHPGLRWPDWPGKLAFDTNVKSKIDGGTPTVSLHELVLVGRLIDQPLQAAGNLTFHGISKVSGDLKVHSGNNALNISGKIAKHLDVKFDVDAPNPVSLWPGLRGHLQGRGTVKGMRSSPAGTITLTGNNISYGNYTVQNFHADLVLDLDNTKLSSSKVKLTNIQVNNEVLKSVTLTSVGDFKKHKVCLDIVTPSVNANVKFAGSFYKDAWEAKVKTASFDPAQSNKWRLCNPVHLEVTETELKPFNACWTHKKSSLYMHGSWNEKSGWKVEGDMNDDPLKGMIDMLKEISKKEHLRWGKDHRY
jgi:translocation and assembly module TamB